MHSKYIEKLYTRELELNIYVKEKKLSHTLK